MGFFAGGRSRGLHRACVTLSSIRCRAVSFEAVRLNPGGSTPDGAHLAAPPASARGHAPAGTPRPVIQRLHAAFSGAVQNQEVRARLEQVNQFAVGNTPEEFADFLQENRARLIKVVKDSNIRLE